MTMIEHEDSIRDILQKDDRYTRECYYFVGDALAYTVHKLSDREQTPEEGSEPVVRHVSGQDLLEGIRELAWERFGPLASVVFRQWGLQSTEDFGCVVFNLVDADLMSKQASDTLDDFKGGFDFEEAFAGELDLEIED